MRQLLGITLSALVILSYANPTRSDDAATARTIIDKAIKAAGGAEQIEKYQAHTWQEKGVYYGMGDGLPYTASYAAQSPNKFRMEIPNLFTIVFNGEKGWVKAGDNVMDMDADQIKAQKEETYGGHVTRLVPLKDKAFSLAPLGETQVGGKAAVGVKVTNKGHQDVNLFFAKDTGLLLKAEFTMHSREHGYKEVSEEILYSDYKDVDGIKGPTKIVINRDGKKFVEADVSDMKNLEKLDDKEFGKP